jgi:DNA-binding MarR family transcriptional regulator
MNSNTDFFDMPGDLVRRLHQLSVARFSGCMEEAGLSLTPVQFSTLRVLAATPGIDQATVASSIAYDRATLGKVVDRLVARGLINRFVSPRDRRARELYLTEAGHDMLTAALPRIHEIQPEMLAALTTEEGIEFTRMLRKLVTGPEPQHAQQDTALRSSASG